MGDRRWRIRWLEDQIHNDDYTTPDPNKKQKNDISSFMDDLDYEEWGGPKTSQKTLNTSTSTSTSTTPNTIPGDMHHEFIDILLNPLVGTIGKRLLHKIGYVDKKENTSNLPESKNNSNGIGYDPYVKAPEFKR